MHVDAEYIHFMYVLFINLIDVNSHYFIFPTVEVFYTFIHYSYNTADIMPLYIYLQYGANCVRICSVIFTSIAHKRVIFGNIWRSRVAARDQPNPGRSFTW